MYEMSTLVGHYTMGRWSLGYTKLELELLLTSSKLAK